MTEAPLEVHIDELTLHGFDPRHADAVGESLQSELAEALAGWRPGPAHEEATEAVDAGAVRLPGGAAPRHVGRAVGSRIARALRDEDEDGAGGADREDAGAAEGGARR